jgi:hypothetical protein
MAFSRSQLFVQVAAVAVYYLHLPPPSIALVKDQVWNWYLVASVTKDCSNFRFDTMDRNFPWY